VKLIELREEKEEVHGKAWKDNELEVLFKEVKRATLSKEESHDLADEIEEQHQLGRSHTGIYQILMQLHMIIHGTFPDGVIVYPGNWQTVTGSIIKFAKKKGFEAENNIEKAKTDMAERIKRKKAKINKPDATRLMADYYKEHKSTLPKTITKYRDEIIKDIMDGKSIADTFDKYTK